MAKATVKFINTERFLSQELKLIKEFGDSEIKEIAKEVEKRIQFNILASIQRPGSTGNLARAFFAEKILNGWGIGNIRHLDATVPYWRWINFGRAATGRTTPPPVGGYFGLGNPVPDAGSFRQGRFVKANSTFFINPKNPIQAHNYIARTVQSLNSIISGVLKKRKTI